MLKVVHDADASNENRTAGGSLLDEIVRDGARAMLAAALRAEVAAYVDAHAGEVDENGCRLVVRNGYHGEREVLTAAGAVPVKAPRVNDKRIDAETGERRRSCRVREEREPANDDEAADEAGADGEQQELDDSALDEGVPERLEHRRVRVYGVIGIIRKFL